MKLFYFRSCAAIAGLAGVTSKRMEATFGVPSAANKEYADPHFTQNPLIAAYPADT